MRIVIRSRNLLFLFLLLSLVSFAQSGPATGIPPFGSFAPSGIDTLNLGNLNAHMDFSVFNKPGRGIPFNYSLGFDSSVWAPVQGAWQPVNNWGWHGQTQALTGYVDFSTSSRHCIDPDTGFLVFYNIYTFTAYHDPFGGTHAAVAVAKEDSICSTGYLTSGTANDGSGYTITATGYPDAQVTNRSGQVIDAPENSMNSGTVTDNNGNQITLAGGVFTDTLGATPLTVAGTAPSPVTFTYKDTTNTSRTVSLNYTSYPVQTSFGCSGVAEYNSSSVPLVSSLVYADGSTYSFQYEHTPGGGTGVVTGRIQSVTLPAGGTITYNYTGANNGIICSDGSAAGISRVTTDGTWTYSRSGSGTAWTTTVTAPSLNQTQINFQSASFNFYETQRIAYTGAIGTAKLVQVDTCYNSATIPCNATAITLPIPQRTVQTTLDNNQLASTSTTYNSFGLPLEVRENDFGNSLLRRTVTNYASLGGIEDQPSDVTVYDSSGTNMVAKSTFAYDDTSLIATSGLPQHVGMGSIRGNLTHKNDWLNTTSTYLSTTYNYYDTGMPQSVVDPGGHTASYTYGFSGAYLTQVTMPDTSSPTLAHHTTSANYDSNTGLIITATDQNSQPTSFTYDNVLRPATASYPDGGQTTFTYTSATQTDILQKIDSSRNRHSISQVDSYGRASRTALINSETNPYDQQDTCYNSNGQVAFQSYPYQGGGLGQAKVCSGGGDSFTYDGLGRPKTTTHSDSTSSQVAYTGRATQITDEGNGGSNKSRILQSDALGRMTAACEIYGGKPLMGTSGGPTSCGLDIVGTGFLSNYAYDTLDNLITASQGPTRSYQYDSLSRLTQETIPEKSGVTNYTYNSDSLLYQRVRPAPNQTNPATTVTTTFTYDELHRPRTKAFSDGSTPTATWNYDETSAWGATLLNPVGRLSRETAGATGMTFSYDAMGRVVQNGQCTPRTCFGSSYGLSYSYDSMGNPLTTGNGLGTTFSYGYNVAGRLTTMTSSWIDASHPGTLLSNVHYGAFGLSSSSLGNGVSEAANYNSVGELASFTASQSGTTRYSFSLTHAPDGNITAGNDSQNGSWAYTYDPLNRLKTAAQTGQGFQWDYDRYGNRWHQTLTAGSGGQSSLSFTGSNNHVDGETYDAAGNVTNVGTRVYSYDAENRLITVSGDTTASYVYDADGRRIKSQTYEYLYNLEGRQVAMLNASSGANIYDEVYAGGRHLASYSNSTTSFNHTDWLGSERVRTGPTGAVLETCTSLPFGDGQTCTGTDSSVLHFTGDERDAETGLDHTLFRQFQSLEGRWLSVDPLAGDISDPQSLNRYAYVQDNPTNLTDPLGLYSICYLNTSTWYFEYDNGTKKSR